MKTSRAHGLGLHNVNKSDDVLPHIVSPVFIKQENGKIAPHKLFWPAFWATLNKENITPIEPDIVRSIASKIMVNDTIPSADWPTLSKEQITKILTALSSGLSDEDIPVYISGGKIFQINDSERLSEKEHPAAQPYSWPLAHDVRPADQSLGVRGCKDCHATNASFYFGEIGVDSPFISERRMVKTMTEFQELDAFYVKAFAMSFVFRPWLKVIIIASCLILSAVFTLYAFKGLDRILKVLSGEK